MSPKTYESDTLGILLAGMEQGVKPVFVKCAYNYYRIKRIVDMGDFYVLETPEEEGAVALDDE